MELVLDYSWLCDLLSMRDIIPIAAIGLKLSSSEVINGQRHHL
jgi:hypothetical protein